MLLNLPKFLSDRDMKRIVVPFGSLTEFNVLRDFHGDSKGSCVRPRGHSSYLRPIEAVSADSWTGRTAASSRTSTMPNAALHGPATPR